MVPHVRRWVVSSGVGHPVSMRGILAFARAEFMMSRGGSVVVGAGGGVPRWLDTLAWYLFPWRRWCQDGSGCQMGAGRSPYLAQVYTVYAVPSVSACNLYVDFRATP